MHPWLLFALFANNAWFDNLKGSCRGKSGRFPKFVAKLVAGMLRMEVEDSEEAETLLRLKPLLDFVGKFRDEVVAPQEMKFYHIGASWTSHQDILQASEPTDLEMSQFCGMLGLLVASGVPILEATRLTGETVRHPWLIMAMKSIDERVREGDAIASGLKAAIEEFTWERFVYLVQEAKIPAPNCEETPKLGGAYRVRKIERTMSVSDLIIPDMLRYFRKFLNMVDMGEETGELDTVLYQLRDYHFERASGKREPSPAAWSSEVRELLKELGHYQCAGLPILRSLRLIADSGRHHLLRAEVDHVCERIEGGDTLSEALANCGGQLSAPVLVAMIRAGEMSGALEVVLVRMIE
jgi:hypothetical protein